MDNMTSVTQPVPTPNDTAIALLVRLNPIITAYQYK